MGTLTILDDIRIASPCQANWDDMPGDDRARSCSACSRTVYNIAAMTADEAAALIAGREGRLCARLFRRADGTVITADCPVGAVQPALRPKDRPRRVYALAIALLALLLTWMGTKPGASAPAPSGAGITWDDWVHWAAVSLGIRPAPPATPVFHSVTMGDVY